MYLRCRSCHDALWVEFPSEANRIVTVQCKTCGQEYDLQAGRAPARVSRAVAKQARQVAKGEGIDLPGAYSVVLGALTVEDVQRVQAPAAKSTHGQSGDESYDEAFEPAVKTGLLTAREATQRGQRTSYAQALASRYGFAIAIAYDVADNRVSLLNALRKQPNSGAVPIELKFKAQGASALRWAFAGGTLLLLLAVIYRPEAPVPVALKNTTRTIGAAEVKTDSKGLPVSVSALDPESVLEAYCAADSRQRLKPRGIVASAREVRGMRLGLLRRVQAPNEFLGIDIREDRNSNRWVAGDGVAPIVATRAPAGAELGLANAIGLHPAATTKTYVPPSGAAR